MFKVICQPGNFLWKLREDIERQCKIRQWNSGEGNQYTNHLNIYMYYIIWKVNSQAFPSHWAIPLMPAAAEVRPGWRQKLGIQLESAMWVAETQVLESSPAAFQEAGLGSRTRSWCRYCDIGCWHPTWCVNCCPKHLPLWSDLILDPFLVCFQTGFLILEVICPLLRQSVDVHI